MNESRCTVLEKSVSVIEMEYRGSVKIDIHLWFWQRKKKEEKKCTPLHNCKKRILKLVAVWSFDSASLQGSRRAINLSIYFLQILSMIATNASNIDNEQLWKWKYLQFNKVIIYILSYSSIKNIFSFFSDKIE